MIPQAVNTAGSPDPVTPFFTFQRVRPGIDHVELEQIMALRYDIYCLECGFLPADRYDNGLESDEYDDCSAHFAAHNLRDEIVGTLRLVRPGASQGFPFEQHCCSMYQEIELPTKEACGEVSRLVVRKDYRRRTGDSLTGIADRVETRRHSARSYEHGDRRSSGPQILLGLYREMYRYSLQTGIRYWYAAMERSLAHALKKMGFRFMAIGPEADYYGSVTDRKSVV